MLAAWASVGWPASAPADEASATASTETSQQAKDETADENSSITKADDAGAPAQKPADSNGKVPATGETATVSATGDKPEQPERKKVRLAMLTVKESLMESAGQVGPFGETQLDLRELVGRLDRASRDKTIGGMVLDIRNPDIGRGKVEELRAAIMRFRESGKKVYAQVESAMPTDYLIACACDEIVMPETGTLVLPGMHAEATFFKGLLNKIGIEADFIHIGPYKGAAEPLTRDKFSEPVRENMNSLIDSLYDDMVTTLVKSRPLSIAQAKEIIDEGLITATRAKELGLIDRVAYPDTLRKELAEVYQADPLIYVKNYGQEKVDTDFSGPMGFFKLMRAMMGTDSDSRNANGKKIAIVYAVGPIMTGKSESDPFGGQVMGSTTIVESLREASDDDDVAAIVLRIDSPGGSALASDLIWHETQVIEKPIVASMGDVAASGGYYIAMGADRIYAAPATVTGSIGVVGGKLALRGLYDKLGITTETIERGKNSGLFSSSGKFTDSQQAAVKEMMQDMYRQFTSKAAQGRNMPLDNLEKLAGGRIYSGRQAKDNGLIDELGTLHDAINEAKKLAGIDKDEQVRIETLPEPMNFFETLFGDLGAEEEVRMGGNLDSFEELAPELVDVARRAYRLRAVFDQPAAFVMPFELEIR
ncbi:MAG: signal peptide peptidase SppA [Planctomycetes bacterium]|nr:signal peptide peptidase SppA [Planctomycetota bacterium]